MQEAMDMTPEEFDAAAHQLLTAEHEGTIRLPVGPEVNSWDREDETANISAPMRMGGAVHGRFGNQAEAASQPLAPSRRKKPNGGPNGR